MKLLELIGCEEDAKGYWDLSEVLRAEFPTPGNLWAYIKMKRRGGSKNFLQQGGPERPRATGANPHTVLTFSGPGPSSGSKLFRAVTSQEDA